MSTITFLPQSIKITIRVEQEEDVSSSDYINLYGGISDNPSGIDFNIPLISNIKPSFCRTEIIPDDNPSDNPSAGNFDTTLTYRTWEIYHPIATEGTYQFDYLVYDSFGNQGTISDSNPSDEPENFDVCLTPNKAKSSYDAIYEDNPSNNTAFLTLSF